MPLAVIVSKTKNNPTPIISEYYTISLTESLFLFGRCDRHVINSRWIEYHNSINSSRLMMENQFCVDIQFSYLLKNVSFEQRSISTYASITEVFESVDIAIDQHCLVLKIYIQITKVF